MTENNAGQIFHYRTIEVNRTTQRIVSKMKQIVWERTTEEIMGKVETFNITTEKSELLKVTSDQRINFIFLVIFVFSLNYFLIITMAKLFDIGYIQVLYNSIF